MMQQYFYVSVTGSLLWGEHGMKHTYEARRSKEISLRGKEEVKLNIFTFSIQKVFFMD